MQRRAYKIGPELSPSAGSFGEPGSGSWSLSVSSCSWQARSTSTPWSVPRTSGRSLPRKREKRTPVPGVYPRSASERVSLQKGSLRYWVRALTSLPTLALALASATDLISCSITSAPSRCRKAAIPLARNGASFCAHRQAVWRYRGSFPTRFRLDTRRVMTRNSYLLRVRSNPLSQQRLDAQDADRGEFGGHRA
jgi:hypothetical protein